MTRKSIDEFGAIFRFITPILILVVSFFLTRELQTINSTIKSLENHEKAHTIWSQKVLRRMEVRFIRIENKIGIENNIELDPGRGDDNTKNNFTRMENQLCNFYYPYSPFL